MMIHIEMLLDFELRIVVNLSWNKDPGYCPGYGEYIVKKKKKLVNYTRQHSLIIMHYLETNKEMRP